MRRILGAVLAAHYLAAFTALGMPVFMSRVLAQLAPHSPDWMVGMLYVLPTICTALTATTWGKLADRYGRKLSLMRAQLGLACGFVLAGFAPNLPVFVLALMIQGGCGGSLAAANAYLATQTQGASLSRALDWTQFSARLAMLTAPVLLGLATDRGLAQGLYAWLALLPLLGLAITGRLPADTPTRKPQPLRDTVAIPTRRFSGELIGLLGVQFLYYFAVVVTFPYFILYSHRLGITDDGLAGLAYSLPHLVYLLMLPFLRSASPAPLRPLLFGLSLLVATSWLQAMPMHAALLWPLRALYGVGITLAITGLNRALSSCAARMSAGRLFGLFDACGKWAGALGGIAAGALVHRYGLAMPFFAAALAGALALVATILVHSKLLRGLPRRRGDGDSPRQKRSSALGSRAG